MTGYTDPIVQDIGSAEILPDAVNDTHIDWGTGTNQVSAVDVPIADSGAYYTGTEVETALQEIGAAINTTIPATYLKLDCSNDPLIGTNSTTFFQVQQSDNTVVFNVDTTNARVGVNTSSPSADIHAISTGSGTAFRMQAYHNNAATYGAFQAYRARGTEASPLSLQDGDGILSLVGQMHDGNTFRPAASILFEVDGTPSTNDDPGRIVFNTTPDGGFAVVERMRISNDGQVLITNATASVVPFVLKGAASQSANLQEWSTSSSSVAAVGSSGKNWAIGTATVSAHRNLYMPIASTAVDDDKAIIFVDHQVQITSGASTKKYIGYQGLAHTLSGNTQNVANLIGFQFDAYTQNTSGTVTSLIGAQPRVYALAATTVTNMIANDLYVDAEDATVTSMYGTRIDTFDLDTGTVTNAYGHYMATPVIGAGTMTNLYGIFLQNMTGATNSYGIYVEGGATEAVHIETGATTAIGLVVKGAASQSADHVQIQDNSANVLGGFDEQGYVQSHGVFSTTNFFAGDGVAGSSVLAHTTGNEGWYNVGIGQQALNNITTGNLNVCIGYRAGLSISSGAGNTFIGFTAGQNTTTPTGNVAMGDRALFTNETGEANFALGAQALTTTTGSYSVAIGAQAGFAQTTGGSNTCIGRLSGYSQQEGVGNVYVANSSGQGAANYSSSYNIFIGSEAGKNITTSSVTGGNVGVGWQAGYSVGAGEYNTYLGGRAGRSTTGDRNIFIGFDAGYRQVATSNTLLVSNQIYADAATELSHSIIYGVMAANPEDQTLRLNTDALTIGTDADADVVLSFAANTNSGEMTWMEDEDYFEFDDAVKIPSLDLSDGNITNVGDIALDSLTADDGTGPIIVNDHFRLNDNIRLYFGTDSNSYIGSINAPPAVDALIIKNTTSDADIIVNVNDGGVDTTSLTIDGATANVEVSKALLFTGGNWPHSIQLRTEVGGSVMAFGSEQSGTNATFLINTADSDGTDNVSLDIYATGTFDPLADYERLRFLYDPTAPDFKIYTDNAGTGTSRPIRIFANPFTDTDQLYINTDGKVGIQETSPGASLHVTTPAAATIPFIIEQAAGQSAHTYDIKDSSGVIIGGVDKTGVLFVNKGSFGQTSIPPTTTAHEGLMIGVANSTTNTITRGAWIGVDGTNTSSSNRNLFGLNAFAYQSGSGGRTGSIYAARYASRLATSGTYSELVGIHIKDEVQSGTPSVAIWRDIEIESIYDGATITTASMIYGHTPVKSGTITTQYGIYLENINVATTNYSWYSNLGDVSFGDDVIVRNDSDKLWFGGGKDFSIYHDGTSMIFNVDQATDEIVFNEGGIDTNFRVEGNTITDLFKTDAGNDQVETHGGRIVNVTTVNAATYDLLVSDDVLHVTYTSTGAVTSLTLPSAQVVAGRRITIKDAGGQAATNNITVDTGGAETIDGEATFVVDGDYDSITLYSDGSNWFVI